MEAREFKRRHEMDVKELHEFVEPFIIRFTDELMTISDEITDEESDAQTMDIFKKYNEEYVSFAKKWNRKFLDSIGKKKKKCVTPMEERWFYDYALNNKVTGKENPYKPEEE
jgi:hypothetical protein